MKNNSPNEEIFIADLNVVGIKDITLVGSKIASLGEIKHSKETNGINVPDGFSVTSIAYWEFIYSNKLQNVFENIFTKLDKEKFSNLETISQTVRELILNAELPPETIKGVEDAYMVLCEKHGPLSEVAIRSSAVIEDRTSANFNGHHVSFLNIRGIKNILNGILHCYASLYSEYAIRSGFEKGFELSRVALPVLIQKMVRSDAACSGTCSTTEAETGFKDIIQIEGCWGLGENMTLGNVDPDVFFVFKKTFQKGKNGIIKKKLGTKEKTMIYAENTDHNINITVVNIPTKEENKIEFILTDPEIGILSEWALKIEEHFKEPMFLEWAKDGMSDELFIVDARVEIIQLQGSASLPIEKEEEIDISNILMPKTKCMLMIDDPDKALPYSFYPNNGVGMLSIDFILSNIIKIHPLALLRFKTIKDRKTKKDIKSFTRHYSDLKEYFIDNLSRSVALIAAAFYPKEVIVRMSHLKTNEFARLIGGKEFESLKESSLTDNQGVSRYSSSHYKDAFHLECEAMKRVREEMGLINVNLMVPSCATAEELKKVIDVMEEFHLKRGENDLHIYMSVDFPSNCLIADEFAKFIDGFSINSDELILHTLDLEVSSGEIKYLYDERSEAMKRLYHQVIDSAKKSKIKVGLCTSSLEHFTDLATFLVGQGIDSISFAPQNLLHGIQNIETAEISKQFQDGRLSL